MKITNDSKVTLELSREEAADLQLIAFTYYDDSVDRDKKVEKFSEYLSGKLAYLREGIEESPFSLCHRYKVYSIIDQERNYQNSLMLGPNNRSDGSTKQVGSFLSLMQSALNDAHKAYYEEKGDVPALHMIRKIAAMAVQCMEIHGCPERT